jgi:glycosyltransferase involved in cell wall biosynthesis
MKVYLQYKPNDTGKGKFLSRLIPELTKLGIKCMYARKGCDVTLSLTRFRDETKGMPKVLRVDGIHLVKSKKTLWRNKIISDSIKKADVVIWQSKFCQRIGTEVLQITPRKDVIIHNAAPRIPCDEQYEAYTRFHGRADKVIALCAKWDYADGKPRLHKRLNSQAELAAWYTAFNPGVEFRIFGRTRDRPFERSGIRYYGHLTEDDLKKQLCACDVLLYLPYYDWMPNSVVESIAAGLPVVASNNGGHAEVADVVIKTDVELPAEMMAREKVPGLAFPEIGKVLDTINRSFVKMTTIKIMQDIALKYKAALEAAIHAHS